MHRFFILLVVIFTTLGCLRRTEAQDRHWYRGNLHTHTLWSDGNDFPEMVTRWFRKNDYHFLALTDHNVLSQSSDRWMAVETVERRAGKDAVAKYIDAFGKAWVERKQIEKDGKSVDMVRLKPLQEFRETFEVPNEFLLIEAEEISDRVGKKPLHLNATNLRSVVQPLGGATIREGIQNNVRAVADQAEKNGEPILVHLNHPNFGWAVKPEEMAMATNGRFFEVYNGHPSVNHLGDAQRPGVERWWDMVNTIRIGELKSPPVYGLATDDSHHYHQSGPKRSTTGRGWIWVHASSLSPTDLFQAMNQGDFYASSGVVLNAVAFQDGKLSLDIATEPGVTYQTKFIGTLASYKKSKQLELNSDGRPKYSTLVAAEEVGWTLAESKSATPSYQLTGEELFVRALVTSSKPHPNPSFDDQREQAWTQPVGWQ